MRKEEHDFILRLSHFLNPFVKLVYEKVVCDGA